MTDAPTTSSGLPPVDRLRRFKFVAAVVTWTLMTSAAFTLLAALGGGLPIYHLDLIELYIGGCLSLATASTLGYITGSVIDYGSANLLGRSKAKSDYILPTSASGAKG